MLTGRYGVPVYPACRFPFADTFFPMIQFRADKMFRKESMEFRNFTRNFRNLFKNYG